MQPAVEKRNRSTVKALKRQGKHLLCGLNGTGVYENIIFSATASAQSVIDHETLQNIAWENTNWRSDYNGASFARRGIRDKRHASQNYK